MASNLRETYTSGDQARARRRAVIEAGFKCYITYGGGSNGDEIALVISLGRQADFSKLPAVEPARRPA